MCVCVRRRYDHNLLRKNCVITLLKWLCWVAVVTLLVKRSNKDLTFPLDTAAILQMIVSILSFQVHTSCND